MRVNFNTLSVVPMRYRTWHYSLMGIGFLLGLWLALILWNSGLLGHPQRANVQAPYIYKVYTASNGVVLHTMQTRPDNIELKAIDSNVTDTDEFGLNGGFFWNGDLLSIAVINDKPVKGEPHNYGSGWSNIDYPKGTLVWDAVSRRFSVQVVDAANRIQVTDRNRYWAQGGVSMSLSDDAGWREEALREDMPAMDKPHLRSGAVYNDKGLLWLIATDHPCTVEQFRAAIKETVAPGERIEGVFLDGDGSTQMRNREVSLRGDTRHVYQMLAIKN